MQFRNSSSTRVLIISCSSNQQQTAHLLRLISSIANNNSCLCFRSEPRYSNRCFCLLIRKYKNDNHQHLINSSSASIVGFEAPIIFPWPSVVVVVQAMICCTSFHGCHSSSNWHHSPNHRNSSTRCHWDQFIHSLCRSRISTVGRLMWAQIWLRAIPECSVVVAAVASLHHAIQRNFSFDNLSLLLICVSTACSDS